MYLPSQDMGEYRNVSEREGYMQEAAKSLYVANADEIVRQQCRACEDAERRKRTLERDKRLLEQKVSEQGEQISEQATQINEQAAQLREKDSNTAFVLLQNGVDYNIVRASIPALSNEELQDIYQKVQNA